MAESSRHSMAGFDHDELAKIFAQVIEDVLPNLMQQLFARQTEDLKKIFQRSDASNIMSTTLQLSPLEQVSKDIVFKEPADGSMDIVTGISGNTAAKEAQEASLQVWAQPSKSRRGEMHAIFKALENAEKLQMPAGLNRVLGIKRLDMCDCCHSDKHCLPARIRAILQHVLEHRYFAKIIVVLILVNAIAMAVEADDMIKRVIKAFNVALENKSDSVILGDTPQVYLRLDLFFAGVFTLEVSSRIAVYDLQFFIGRDAGWNLLDLGVTIFAWIDVSQVIVDMGGTGVFPPLRLLRVARFIRSLRLIRSMRFFTELRLVLLSLMNSVKPLLWSMLTLVGVQFVFANLFLQIVAGYLLHNVPDPNMQVENHWSILMCDWFSSFMRTMITLLAIVSGGDDWDPLYRAFLQASKFGASVYVLYIIIVIFGMLNVIAAVFVEGALSKAKADQYLVLREGQDHRKEMAHELIRVFNQIDFDNSGQISLDEWQSFLRTDYGEQFLLLFDIDLPHALEMFEVLDHTGDGLIAIEEFGMTFMQVSASPNKLDLEISHKRNQHSTKKILKKLEDARTDARTHWSSVHERLAFLEASLANTTLRANGLSSKGYVDSVV